MTVAFAVVDEESTPATDTAATKTRAKETAAARARAIHAAPADALVSFTVPVFEALYFMSRRTATSTITELLVAGVIHRREHKRALFGRRAEIDAFLLGRHEAAPTDRKRSR